MNFQNIDSFKDNFQSADAVCTRTCPVCSCSDHKLIMELSDFQFFTDSAEMPKRVTLRQVQCRRCLTLYLNPCFTADGFSNLFAEAGCSYGSTALRPLEQKEWLTARGLLAPGKVLLDVGCYEGSFLGKLPEHVERIGVDIDAPAIARGLERDPSLELVCSPFESFSITRMPDVITMFHVLEHVTQPVEVLKRLRAVSAAGARLVVEVPILEYGETNDICGFFSVQHVTHFSRHTLASVLAAAGWQIEEATKIDGYNGYRVVATKTDPKKHPKSCNDDILALQSVMTAWYKAQRAVEEKIRSIGEKEQVILWGAGLHTEYLYHLTSLFQSCGRRFMLVDSDPIKQWHCWRGIPIYSPSILLDLKWDQSVLVISSYGGQEAIFNSSLALGVPEERTLPLYDEIFSY